MRSYSIYVQIKVDSKQAVTVQVGTDSSGNAPSSVALHPGGLYGSMIDMNKLCSDTPSSTPCFAEPAGLYDPDSSFSVYQNDTSSSGNNYPVAMEKRRCGG